MTGMVALKAAYVIAWVVYLGYLFRMLTRLREVERELKEVENTNATAARKAATEVQQRA